MPIIECHNRADLDLDVKVQLGKEITEVVKNVIKSPDDLITVLFHDHPAESTYRAGVPTDDDTVIICHIRKGRSDAAIETLLSEVSQTWSRLTDTGLDKIEVGAAEYPAKHTMRGGALLPEPPIV